MVKQRANKQGIVLSSFSCCALHNSCPCRQNRYQNLVDTLSFFNFFNVFSFYFFLTCSVMMSLTTNLNPHIGICPKENQLRGLKEIQMINPAFFSFQDWHPRWILETLSILLFYITSQSGEQICQCFYSFNIITRWL